MLHYEVFMMNTIAVIFIIFFINTSFANNFGTETGLEIPRYVSLKSNDSNIRVGPSINYPILIKYIAKNYPLKVVEEYDEWRKVVDFKDKEGWIHKSLIKGERNGIIISKSKNNINVLNTVGGKIIGEVEIDTIVLLSKCKKEYCLIIKGNHKGWVNKKNIWGVKSNEIFKITFFQSVEDYLFMLINFIEEYIS